MTKWLFRWFYKRELKSIRNRIESLDRKMKAHPDPEFRAYHAQTEPARMRFKETLDRALQMEEPLRTKFILYLVGQFYGLSWSYADYFKQLCSLDVWPFPKTDMGFYLRLAESHTENLKGLFLRLLDLYNEEQGSRYKPDDFLLPQSDGQFRVQALHNAAMTVVKENLSLKDVALPIGFCHFEMERLALLLEISLAEIKAGTEFAEPLLSFNGIGIGHLGSCPIKPFPSVGIQTIDAITQMIQTAYDRAR